MLSVVCCNKHGYCTSGCLDTGGGIPTALTCTLNPLTRLPIVDYAHAYVPLLWDFIRWNTVLSNNDTSPTSTTSDAATSSARAYPYTWAVPPNQKKKVKKVSLPVAPSLLPSPPSLSNFILSLSTLESIYSLHFFFYGFLLFSNHSPRFFSTHLSPRQSRSWEFTIIRLHRDTSLTRTDLRTHAHAHSTRHPPSITIILNISAEDERALESKSKDHQLPVTCISVTFPSTPILDAHDPRHRYHDCGLPSCPMLLPARLRLNMHLQRRA